MTSRRAFLKRLFLAGAAVAVVPAVLLEAPKPENPFLAVWEWLKRHSARKLGPDYVAFVPSQVAQDLMQAATFMDQSHYSHVKRLYEGEFGMMYGVRLVENSSPFTA